MSLRKRIFLWVAGGLAGLVLLVGITAVFLLQSSWFFDKVRQLIIGTVETATGGRVEVASFRFDWRHLRAEVRGFVLHGTEAGEQTAAVSRRERGGGTQGGARSCARMWTFSRLTVTNPHVYLIIGSDGRTNVPEPKVRRTSKTSTMEDILKLAIRRFDLQRGLFEVEARSRIPFRPARREPERPAGVRPAWPALSRHGGHPTPVCQL